MRMHSKCNSCNKVHKNWDGIVCNECGSDKADIKPPNTMTVTRNMDGTISTDSTLRFDFDPNPNGSNIEFNDNNNSYSIFGIGDYSKESFTLSRSAGTYPGCTCSNCTGVSAT